MAELVLIRHGETEWNKIRRIQGALDVPLNETGIAQAHCAADYLATQSLINPVIVSSDLDRARATATITAQRLQLPLKLHAGLRERHYGVLQGQYYDDMATFNFSAAQALNDQNPDFDPGGGGETIRYFHQRVLATLSELAVQYAQQTILVFTHGGVLDVAYRRIHGLTYDAPRDYSLLNASVNRISINDEQWSLLAWGYVEHLISTRDELV